MDSQPAGSGERVTSWGAAVLGDATRFRVWAPLHQRIRLRLAGRDLPMRRSADGWFEITTPAPPGTEYLFVLDDGTALPDPASRAQAGALDGPSLVVDSDAYTWATPDWRGRPWEEVVFLELHVGTFTPEGTFRAAIDKLGWLAELGITAIELMPVAQFAGERGWGYDGALLYAPHPAYGTPDDLRALVDAAHGHGLMVFLDVVYNHFGPEGNVLPRFAPVFHEEAATPWGAAIAYERPPLRRFFIENALYWLDEFRIDGLRLDAVDHIADPESEVEILVELAEAIRAAFPDRHVHTTTEDNRNVTHLHVRDAAGRSRLHTAEWNDDLHNVAHVICTGETEGYYVDFAVDHWGKFARALAEGFAYQGEPSRHENGAPRGTPSGHLPPAAFVDFLQNHDQVGNRAYGERLTTLTPAPLLRAMSAILLLSPHIPLLFMGEEWGETQPFVFFTDFHGALADAVRDGRRKEFRHFAAFHDAAARESIPDPNAPETFEASKLVWAHRERPEGRAWLEHTRGLLAIRHREIVPHLAGAGPSSGSVVAADDGIVAVDWRLDGIALRLRANLTPDPATAPPAAGRAIYGGEHRGAELPGHTVRLTVAPR
jgi:malto-oligosyltrehalose trehalohydrolase